MTAVDVAFTLIFMGGLGVSVLFMALIGVAAHHAAYPDEIMQCTPTRRANITANTTQAQRRMVLGRIDATYTVPVMAATQQPRRQPAADYAVPRPCDVDAIKAGSVTYDLASLTAPAVPEVAPVAPVEVAVVEQGIAVDDWPTQVVQPVPLRSR